MRDYIKSVRGNNMQAPKINGEFLQEVERFDDIYKWECCIGKIFAWAKKRN